MKTTFQKILRILVLLVSAVQGNSLMAQAPDARASTPKPSNPYELRNIQRVTKLRAWVDNAWKSGTPCVQVELHVSRAPEDSKTYVRAYFFDKDGAVVLKYNKPPETSDDNVNYTAMPAALLPKHPAKVAFPVSDKANLPGHKWNRAIVVFGDNEFAVAECLPKDDINKFIFPEKDLVLQSLPQKTGTSPGASPLGAPKFPQ